MSEAEGKPEFPADVWRTASDMPLDDTGDMDHDISVAIARGIMAERERCASKWLPIESAPDLGMDHWVLVWDGRKVHVASVWWHEDGGQPVWFNGDVSVDATHWQPLPPPPNGDVRG